MQEVLCLLQHHCCVIHMVVQISRQARKELGVESEAETLPPALIAAVPLSKVLRHYVMTFS